MRVGFVGSIYKNDRQQKKINYRFIELSIFNRLLLTRFVVGVLTPPQFV